MRIAGEHIAIEDILPDLPKSQKELFASILNEDFKGVIHKADFNRLLKGIKGTPQRLLNTLLKVAAQYSVSPISNFKVGAVIVGHSGNIYFGTNLEFPGTAINSTLHAEQSAVSLAYSQNETGIHTLAVSASPCGHCRQFLNEVCPDSPLNVFIGAERDYLLADLLPDAFSGKDIDVNQTLFEQKRKLSHSNNVLPEEVVKEVAHSSFSPYSDTRAGMILKTESNDVFSGPYIESAAFNPSISPLLSALIPLIFSGIPVSEITDGYFYQSPGAISDQKNFCHSLLKQLSNARFHCCS